MASVQSSYVTAEQLADAEAQFEKALKLRDSDLETAVQLLGQVLETRNKAYGENALECADTYLYYGQCLFEQAQASSDCFGDQIKSAANQRAKAIAAAEDSHPKSEAADAAGRGTEAVASAEPPPPAAPTQEPATAATPAADGPGPAQLDSKREDAETHEEAAADDSGGASDVNDGGDCSSNSSDEGGDHDADELEDNRTDTTGQEQPSATGETDDMALAWEMLELARLIYNNHGCDTHANKLADCHLYIGDILAEQEKFEAAVEEYKTAQDMLARIEGGHTGHRRRAAELEFKKATSLQLLDAPAEALAAMEQAKAHLTAHLATVNAQIKQSCSSGADAAGAVASAAFASILSSYASSAPSSEHAAAAADEGRDELAKLHQDAADLQGTIDSIVDRIEELSSAVQEHISMKEQLANIFKAVAAEGGDSSTQQAAAGSSNCVVETIGFGAAGSSVPAGEVQDIGVIGRGKRAAPTPAQPAAAAAGGAAAEGGRAVTDQVAAGVTGEASRKRPLSDLSSSDQEAAEASTMADNGAAKVAAVATGRDAEQLDAAPKRPCL